MHTIDLVLVCTAALVVVIFSAILARQRQILRSTGAMPMALQRGSRWLYGIGRYVGPELRFYRAIGLGTRPNRVLRRGAVQVIRHRSPLQSELSALPAAAVVAECRVGEQTLTFALSDGAFTGFVSWLESSAPMP